VVEETSTTDQIKTIMETNRVTSMKKKRNLHIIRTKINKGKILVLPPTIRVLSIINQFIVLWFLSQRHLKQ
jgi:hypothetical protein